MDPADITIEGAGFAIVAALIAGTFAAVRDRRRIVLGTAIGLTLATIAIPFVAYFVARITNHQATDADLTPPTFIVVTALVCAGLTLAGLLGGVIAEYRRNLRGPYEDLDQRPHPADDSDMIDNPALWLPWKHDSGDRPQALT